MQLPAAYNQTGGASEIIPSFVYDLALGDGGP